METFIKTTPFATCVNLSKVVVAYATNEGIGLELDDGRKLAVKVPDVPPRLLAEAFFKAVDDTPRMLVTSTDIQAAAKKLETDNGH